MIDLPSEVAQLSPKLVGRFLILVGHGNPKGAVSGREFRCRGCWALLIADLMSFLDYFNFKNIPFKVLHSCKKKSCVDKNPRRKRPIFVMERTVFKAPTKWLLRWLDWIFWGWYLPSLSINYVRMSKDMEKRLPQLCYIKMKISHDLCFIAIGVAMAT